MLEWREKVGKKKRRRGEGGWEEKGGVEGERMRKEEGEGKGGVEVLFWSSPFIEIVVFLPRLVWFKNIWWVTDTQKLNLKRLYANFTFVQKFYWDYHRPGIWIIFKLWLGILNNYFSFYKLIQREVLEKVLEDVNEKDMNTVYIDKHEYI